MADSLNLALEVHRLAGPDYDPGYTAPETTDTQSIAFADTSVGIVADDPGHLPTTFPTAARRPAMQQTPNEFGWRTQHAMEVGAFRETVVAMTQTDGGQVILNTNHASVWEIDAAGGVTFSFAAEDPIEPPDASAPVPSYVNSLVVIVRRASGGTINWPTSISWDSSLPSTTFTPPTGTRIDTYVLVQSRTFGWLGHVIAQGYVPLAQ